MATSSNGNPDGDSDQGQTFADLLNGFTLGNSRPHARRDDVREPDHPAPPGEPAHRPGPDYHRPGNGGRAYDPPPPPAPYDLGDEAAIVRPYTWTGGRTRSSYGLKLETLVSSSVLGHKEALLDRSEYQAVSALCRHPHSVAEVAAKLSIPLGVARVILSDMAELGLILPHQTVADDDFTAHLALMERVLSGLRRL